MEVIYNIFKWFVQAIGDLLNIITSIPTYVGKLTYIITTFVPAPILSILMICIAAYVIIHIKRLVF